MANNKQNNKKSSVEDVFNDVTYQSKKNAFEHTITQRIYNKDIARLFLNNNFSDDHILRETKVRLRLEDKLEKKREEEHKKRKEELQKKKEEFTTLMKEFIADINERKKVKLNRK